MLKRKLGIKFDFFIAFFFAALYLSLQLINSIIIMPKLSTNVLTKAARKEVGGHVREDRL